MRKLLSLLLVICMLAPTGIITAYAQDETLFNSTSGDKIQNGTSEGYEKGVMGRDANDTSTFIKRSGGGKVYYVQNGTQWLEGGDYENGYVVMGASFYAVNNIASVSLRSTDVDVVAPVSMSDSRLNKGWNKVVFVYQPSTSDGKISTADQTYYAGNWTCYLNGTEINTWGENRAKLTNDKQVAHTSFRLNFSASSSSTEMQLYTDDGFMYLTNTKPDLTETVPTVLASDTNYAISSDTLVLKKNISADAISVTPGATLRVYSDSTYTSEIGTGTVLTTGNTLVLQKDGIFSYYTISADSLYKVFYDDNEGYASFHNTVIRSKQTGVMGRAADDTSTYAYRGGTDSDGTAYKDGKMYYAVSDDNKEYWLGESWNNGYIVIETSFYSLKDIYRVVLGCTGGLNLTGDIQLGDNALVQAGWNKLAFVYQPSTSDGQISTDTKNYYAGNWTAYINGVMVNAWGENRAKITHQNQIDISQLRLMFYAQYTTLPDMEMYLDDTKMYVISEKPDLSETMPTPSENPVSYLVSGTTLSVASGTTLSDITVPQGTQVRGYSDSTLKTQFDASAQLEGGNVIVLQKDGLFSYYTVSDERFVNDTYFFGFEDNTLPGALSTGDIDNITYENGIMYGSVASVDPKIFIDTPIYTEDFDELRIRMKYTPDEANKSKSPFMQVYYQGTAPDGTSISMNTANSETVNLDTSRNGEFVTYTVNFDNYYWNRANISRLRIDPVSVNGGELEIDYIMLCKKTDTLNWSFEGGFDGWSGNKSAGEYSAGNGYVTATVPGDATSVDTQLTIDGLSVDSGLYKQLEVIASRDITSDTDSDVMRLYSAYTDSEGNSNAYQESTAVNIADAPTVTNGEQRRWVFNLGESEAWESGNTVTALRLDIINSIGSYTVDSIRLIPKGDEKEAFNASEVTLNYAFANTDEGCAKGIMNIDFGGVSAKNALNVRFSWGNGGTPLPDYTVLYSCAGEEAAEGYTVTKDLIIPETATQLVAEITDCEKTFTVAYDIPEAKLIPQAEPTDIIALTSDWHFGWTYALTAPSSTHNKAYQHINSYADMVLVAGDITQWYGAYSKAAMDTLTDSDPNNDNPTAGVGQFEVADTLFKKFTIPVYMTEGNHDTPEGNYTPEKTNGATSSERYKEYLTNWIDYSVKNGFYKDEIVRETIYRDNTEQLATFYDDYWNGYHIISLRAPHNGDYSMADGELDWLDAKLYEYEESGKPIFIVTHAPYSNSGAGIDGKWQFTNERFGEIIAKHPNVVVVSGHSHFEFSNVVNATVNGKGDAPSFIHDGGITGTDVCYYDEDGTFHSFAQNAKSMWVYAEIYDDRIIARGYDLNSGKWVSQATSQINLKPDCTIENLTVTSEESGDNVTYTAESATAGLTYQWYVDGVAQDTTGASLTLSKEFEGYIAVRATNQGGEYRSMSYNLNKNGRRAIVEVGKDSENAAVIFAAYDSNTKIVNLTATTKNLTKGMNTVELPEFDGTDAKEIKVFAWENLDTLKPLGKASWALK